MNYLKDSIQSNFFHSQTIFNQSNFNSKILKDITDILGIDFSPYSTKSKLIDETLLKTRTEIAHGEYSVFDRNQYVELHQEIINLLDLFKNQIENAAIEERFKRKLP